MTNLTDKLKKGIAIGAITAGSILGLNSNEAYAQVSTLNEKGSGTQSKVLQKDMLNAFDIPGYVVINKDDKEATPIETVEFYPTFSTMRGNKQLIPRLIYGMEKAQVNGQDADLAIYRMDPETKKNIEDLFVAKGAGGGIITLSADEAKNAGFHTITTDNGTFVYMPLDEESNKFDQETKEKIEETKRIGLAWEAEGMNIYADVDPKDRTINYLVGKPNKMYWIDLDENKVVDQALYDEGKNLLDSMKRDYLASDKAKAIYLGGNLIDGKAFDLKNFAFLDCDDCEPEKKSNTGFRIKSEAGATIPFIDGKPGFYGALNPQIRLGDNFATGIKVSYETSGKFSQESSQEEPIRQLVNLPTDMYFVNTGQKVDKSTEVTNGLGLSVNASYIKGPFQITAGVGTREQTIKEDYNSKGQEYMESWGIIDPSSVTNYDESNTKITKNSLFEGSPAKFDLDVSYELPFVPNLSIATGASYVTGDYGGLEGKIGVTYDLNFGKSKKE